MVWRVEAREPGGAAMKTNADSKKAAMARGNGTTKWSHKTHEQLSAMTHEELLAHLRAVFADAAAHGHKMDWTAIALGIIGDAPADGGGGVDCRSAARQLGVSASTIRRWLRTGACTDAAERISAESGVPMHLITAEATGTKDTKCSWRLFKKSALIELGMSGRVKASEIIGCRPVPIGEARTRRPIPNISRSSVKVIDRHCSNEIARLRNSKISKDAKPSYLTFIVPRAWDSNARWQHCLPVSNRAIHLLLSQIINCERMLSR
jgi:hypothetical protein